MPQVQVIQPIQQQPKRLRVAAYARVSSDSEDQLNSLAVQVDYYTHLIQENPNWEFAGIYTDEGITGTSTKRREQFNRLMDDCRAGLIDRVLVRLYQIQQHPEIIHNPKEQCNTRSIEVAQLDHEIHTALALPELDADAIIDKILRRAELQFNYCAAGDDDPTTMQIKRACKEFKPTDTFPESFYSSIVSKIILHLDTHIDIKLRNGQTL